MRQMRIGSELKGRPLSRHSNAKEFIVVDKCSVQDGIEVRDFSLWYKGYKAGLCHGLYSTIRAAIWIA
jgi:hypothetical protein